MKRSRAALLTTSILIAISITGLVWFRNQPVLRSTSQPNGRANTAAGVQPSQDSRRTGLRPLYGKDSLSPEEKQILNESFDGMWICLGDEGTLILDASRAMPRCYQIGMICLKRRLNRSEVLKLVTAKPDPSPVPHLQAGIVYYQMGPDTLFQIEFTREGSIEKVQLNHAWFKFPALEDVKPDTPIDPPPRPPGWKGGD